MKKLVAFIRDIRTRTILVILVTTMIIITFSCFVGILFTKSRVEESQETDMLVVADIAERYISRDIELLKCKTASIVETVTERIESPGDPGLLEALLKMQEKNPEFIGFTVFSPMGEIIASAGDTPATPEILTDKDVKKAAAENRIAFSSSIPLTASNDGEKKVVFYIAAPLPAPDGGLLVLTLPGMYFRQLVSSFVIWETGHIFIDDAEGHVIANMRENWVLNRHNFIKLSENDPQYEEIAATIKRGANGETGTGYFTLSGVQRLCAFTSISASQEGWFLGVVAPLPESQLPNIINGLIIVGLISFFLSIIAAVIASNFIGKLSARMTNALRESHDRTMLILDSMPYVCHLWNKNFEMFDCNEENVRLFKLNNKNEVAERFSELAPEYQLDGRLTTDVVPDMLGKAFQEGLVVGEFMHQTTEGEPLPVEMTLVRIKYGDDYAVAAYARDLREFNKMMAEINDKNEKINIAMREAQAANTSKSEFLANISHEMRTPLNAVLGISGLTLETEDLEAGVASNLEKIYSSGSTLLSIVNDILDISKIEAGKLQLIPNEYDLPSLINDVVTQNVLRIGSKLIEFKLNISPDIPAVLYGDDLRIKQIMNNLLSNAFKYTNEGYVELGVRSECGEDSETIWMTIWVKDTGVGIRSEDIEKLFSDYAQVDTKSNRRIEGTGLGLAITKKMVRMMNGTIGVESEYGVGSVFTVKVKQGIISDAVIGEEVVKNLTKFNYPDAKRKQSARKTRIKMPYAKVLVVDDNLTNLDVAKGLMKPYGMHIDGVTRGQSAIDVITAEEIKYDAVFMDHMMPEMDGIEALRRIREIDTDYARNIPIIALTANAIAGNDKKFLNEGFQDFLSKPIDLQRLDDVLRRWVRDKSKEKEEHGESAGRGAAETRDPSRNAAGNSIEGINIDKGIEHFGGDKELYLDVLRSYAANTRPILERIKKVREDNLHEYEIDVHGIKGASHGIFADAVGNLAQALEKEAKIGNYDFVSDNNAHFIELTERLIDDIVERLTERLT